MTSTPQSRTARESHPLNSGLFELRYPRSLGTYGTYQEVQAVVDLLADQEFPVETTMIVGTDLRLIERVTGRKTWGRVIGSGIASGLGMGLFIGVLFMLFSPTPLTSLLTSILIGIVFFTVWAVIGHALSSGKRDFTSMTATVPMQYELLIEHTHEQQARQVLLGAGATPPQPAAPQSPEAVQSSAGARSAPGAAATAPERSAQRPSYGQPAPQEPHAPEQRLEADGEEHPRT